MQEKTKKYVLIGLLAATAVALIWFIADLHINALFATVVGAAVSLAWWGTMLSVTVKARRNAILVMGGFWTVIAFFMFFPFPAPEAPQYVVGEVHRFSEMNHGFGRAYMGVLGPNLVNHGYVYTNKDLVEPLAAVRGGRKPSFTCGYPLSRALFGGTTLMDGLRAPNQLSGEPRRITPYPWTTFEGAKRDHKLGWNEGDVLLADVAKKVGYEKARYTEEENALMIKEIGLWLGSEAVGICKVDPRWYYSHDIMTAGTPLPLEEVRQLTNGIQVYTDQRWKRILADPGSGWWSISKSGQAYSTSAWIAVRLAQMLRDMGYEARVGHGGIDYETIETPFSIYTGLGEYGRLSDAVVPSVGGLRFKSATILTDFPMQADPIRESYGVTRFCEHCNRCARACPVDAIPRGEQTVANGVQMWHVDKDKCARFRVGNLGGNCCNECLKNCPYNKPQNLFHQLGSYMTKHSYLAPVLFGGVNGVGLENWLDYENSHLSGEFGVNRPARWIVENEGFTNVFPRQVGRYIYLEEDRSPHEEWSTGVGAKMGKIGLTYRGEKFGEIDQRFFTSDGRPRNVHQDYPAGELSDHEQNIGEVLTVEEARRRLDAGEAFTGGWYHADEDVYPPRSKYEKGLWTYEEAIEDWTKH